MTHVCEIHGSNVGWKQTILRLIMIMTTNKLNN